MAILRFGAFELDGERRELRRSGLRVRLQPQPFKVLETLASRPGEPVTRDELRRLLWPDGTFVAFDAGLNFCLRRVRLALGDDPRSPRFVETLPRHGYRFVAPVERVEGAPPAPRAWPLAVRRAAALLAFGLAAFGVSLAWTLRRPEAGPAGDPVALAAYAKARELCGPEGWRESIGLYAQAVRRDPAFASAFAGMAESYLALAEHGGLDPERALPAAGQAAQRALRIQDRADARRVLGVVQLGYAWDWPGSERELRHALTLDPEARAPQLSFARYLSARGRHAEAVEVMKRLEAREPGSGDVVAEAAACYYRARRYEDAARALRHLPEARGLDAHHRLFGVYRRLGRDAEAFEEAREVMLRAGVPPDTIAGLARLGPRDAGRLYLRGALEAREREAERQREPPDALALLHAALGQREAALRRLAEAADGRYPSLPTALMDPDLDPLRDDPRFVALARRVGSPAAALDAHRNRL
jgi:DNA-binding winged helix-turn-helix (wHTH) protein/tetratricopeptide (TPR) repeat protein